MRLLKLALAIAIAIALFAAYLAFVIGVISLPLNLGSTLSFAIVIGLALGGGVFFVFLEECSKHVPFLIAFLRWLDDRDNQKN